MLPILVEVVFPNALCGDLGHLDCAIDKPLRKIVLPSLVRGEIKEIDRYLPVKIRGYPNRCAPNYGLKYMQFSLWSFDRLYGV